MEAVREATRENGRDHRQPSRRRDFAPAPESAHRMLALQQQAGNQAVQELLRRRSIQAKLTVSQAGDPEEREADQVADRVMRSSTITSTVLPGSSATSDAPVAREPATEERADGVPPLVHDVLESPGVPLDPPTQAFFETRFGRDFRNVRLHTGPAAAKSAQAIEALAYTAGSNIVFDASRLQPASPAGRHVLAHELTHVVQQGSARPSRVQRIVELRPPGRGEASAFDRRQEVIDRMNGLSTGLTYALAGQRITYTVTDASKATPFDRQMERFIDRAEVVPMRLITSAGRVGSRATGFGSLLIDSFQAGYLDLDDMKASDDNSFKMNLLHLLTERFAVPNYERRIGTNFSQAEFDRAHADGLQAETQYLRDTIGDQTIRFVFEETKPDGTLVFGYVSDEGYHVFHVFLRTGQAVSGGHVWVQTRDNRHISIDQLITERAARAAPPVRP